MFSVAFRQLVYSWRRRLQVVLPAGLQSPAVGLFHQSLEPVDVPAGLQEVNLSLPAYREHWNYALHALARILYGSGLGTMHWMPSGSTWGSPSRLLQVVIFCILRFCTLGRAAGLRCINDFRKPSVSSTLGTRAVALRTRARTPSTRSRPRSCSVCLDLASSRWFRSHCPLKRMCAEWPPRPLLRLQAWCLSLGHPCRRFVVCMS